MGYNETKGQTLSSRDMSSYLFSEDLAFLQLVTQNPRQGLFSAKEIRDREQGLVSNEPLS
jgi:hypothetical protein